MHSTFPIVARATPAVLAAEAKRAGQSVEAFRLGTLMRCDTEIANLLDDETLDPHWRDIFVHLVNQVRVAIGDDSRLHS